MADDDDYINLAKSTPEAQLFLKNFPESIIEIDRSGKLAVDFRVDYKTGENNPLLNEYVRLRIFVNSNASKVNDMFGESRKNRQSTIISRSNLMQELKSGLLSKNKL